MLKKIISCLTNLGPSERPQFGHKLKYSNDSIHLGLDSTLKFHYKIPTFAFTQHKEKSIFVGCGFDHSLCDEYVLHGELLMASSHTTRKHSALTQWCSVHIQMLSYEDILSITVYLPPMLFMVGPASIVSNNPWITIVLNALVGFAFSWVLHRVGHRLLKGLPNEPKAVYLSTSSHLPGKLTLTQFVWMMEVIVAVAVFSGVMGKRFFLVSSVLEALSSAILLTLALGLYFLPVYLGNLWIKRYCSALPLMRPTEDIVNKSLFGVHPL